MLCVRHHPDMDMKPCDLVAPPPFAERSAWAVQILGPTVVASLAVHGGLRFGMPLPILKNPSICTATAKCVQNYFTKASSRGCASQGRCVARASWQFELQCPTICFCFDVLVPFEAPVQALQAQGLTQRFKMPTRQERSPGSRLVHPSTPRPGRLGGEN